jgi:hypothetical protein
MSRHDRPRQCAATVLGPSMNEFEMWFTVLTDGRTVAESKHFIANDPYR